MRTLNRNISIIDSKFPFVSIITPSYNSADFIKAAIASVRDQDYPHLEHLIIDGQSTDSTLEILQDSAAPVSWVSEPDQGQADALNKGFRQARGEVIGWLNADDTYQPGAVQAAVIYLQQHPDIDLVYGNFNFINEQDQVIHTHITPKFSLDKLLYAAVIPQPSMFFRHHILDTLGGVDISLHYVLDWEFSFRIARCYNVARLAQTWGNFRIVSGTKSVQQPQKFWPEFITVLEKVVQEEQTQKFKPWGNDALFMAHLLAGLEFARVGQLNAAQVYVDQAFSLSPQPQNHAAVLASGLFKTASYPWHSAFKPHQQAQQALYNLSLCLHNSAEKQRVGGYLCLYQALRQLRLGHRQAIKPNLAQARVLLNGQDFFNWRAIKMMLGAILKP